MHQALNGVRRTFRCGSQGAAHILADVRLFVGEQFREWYDPEFDVACYLTEGLDHGEADAVILIVPRRKERLDAIAAADSGHAEGASRRASYLCDYILVQDRA
jgi:hypothetical protein